MPCALGYCLPAVCPAACGRVSCVVSASVRFCSVCLLCLLVLLSRPVVLSVRTVGARVSLDRSSRDEEPHCLPVRGLYVDPNPEDDQLCRLPAAPGPVLFTYCFSIAIFIFSFVLLQIEYGITLSLVLVLTIRWAVGCCY